ncbi:hypothetical protein [Sphaerisporangium sp. TRM90804]|uniref:hypothetical protein n=1 Tax=Sphaerisporangium sp. TRM90804 TaxID=3031113 RepID=UPI0024472DF6|nr:hypothetical protein [Sphaerisporangium sp. TRM90804]MDH2424851.1 hypothetical protein [Sphaerisporangium sp. TRM90804]
MTSNSNESVNGALWAGVLAVIKELPQETPGTSRTAGEFTKDGATTHVTSVYTVSQPDGGSKAYAITVTVSEGREDHDDYWGPGGFRDRDDPTRRVVIDGEHYLIGDGTGPSRGFGGRRFDVEFFDGRTVATRDLWHQGVIPPKWRDRYPDNARFVKPEQAAEVTA